MRARPAYARVLYGGVMVLIYVRLVLHFAQKTRPARCEEPWWGDA
jgi:hypothetical protein